MPLIHKVAIDIHTITSVLDKFSKGDHFSDQSESSDSNKFP